MYRMLTEFQQSHLYKKKAPSFFIITAPPAASEQRLHDCLPFSLQSLRDSGNMAGKHYPQLNHSQESLRREFFPDIKLNLASAYLWGVRGGGKLTVDVS